MPRIRARSSEAGQGLVEFAIVLPIFVLAIVGLLDVGRLVYTNAALSQAAREGARLAATEAARIGASGGACVDDPSMILPGNPGAYVCPPDTSTFKGHVIDAVNRMAVTLGPVTSVHLSCNLGQGADPAPSGDWTEGGAGNGCSGTINDAGGLVSVRVEYTYRPMTPVISSLVGNLPLSGSATMIIH